VKAVDLIKTYILLLPYAHFYAQHYTCLSFDLSEDVENRLLERS